VPQSALHVPGRGVPLRDRPGSPATVALAGADWAQDWGSTLTRRWRPSGSLAGMNTTDDIHTSFAELGADLVEETGGGLRIVEVGLVIFLGLLVCPPLLILAVVVAVPFIAIAAVAGAVAAAVAVPTALVRRVRAHHREHGSTLFLHRLRP
jgi:hypothetical protein